MAGYSPTIDSPCRGPAPLAGPYIWQTEPFGEVCEKPSKMTFFGPPLRGTKKSRFLRVFNNSPIRDTWDGPRTPIFSKNAFWNKVSAYPQNGQKPGVPKIPGSSPPVHPKIAQNRGFWGFWRGSGEPPSFGIFADFWTKSHCWGLWPHSPRNDRPLAEHCGQGSAFGRPCRTVVGLWPISPIGDRGYAGAYDQ